MPALAGPYAVTGTFPSANVTKCVFTLNTGGASVESDPIVSTDTQATGLSYCKFDLSVAPTGNNTINVAYKNMWGVSQSVPLAFTKTLPPTPSGIKLAE